MVAVGGLEPPRPKAPDFESGVYTNFTTPPLSWIYSCNLTWSLHRHRAGYYRAVRRAMRVKI